MLTFTDSAFDPKGERHQQGWLVCFTNSFLNKNQKAPVSICCWKSRKLPKKAGSPQLTECYAASYGAADTNWVRCILFSLIFGDFNIVTMWPRCIEPKASGPTVLRTDRAEVEDPMMSLLTDSKNVFDALNNELPQEDKKTAIEMPILEEMLRRMFGRCRWIPHNFNPADGLTKLKGANLPR